MMKNKVFLIMVLIATIFAVGCSSNEAETSQDEIESETQEEEIESQEDDMVEEEEISQEERGSESQESEDVLIDELEDEVDLGELI